jgi:hypothetical protein
MLLNGLREFADVRKLTPIIVNTLIRRRQVHNKGNCHKKVDIYFTVAGRSTRSTEKELKN